MDLQQIIMNECLKDTSNLSKETLYSLVLFKLVQDPKFKENYDHITIIERNGENLLFSLPLNNIKGLTNQNLEGLIIDVPTDSPLSFFNNQEEPDYYISDDGINTDGVSLYVKDSVFSNIYNFISIVENANSLNDILENINNKDMLLDFSQYVDSNESFYYSSNMNKLFNIVCSSLIINEKRGFFKLTNKEINPVNSFNSNNCFNFNNLYTFVNKSEEELKEKINSLNALWTFRLLFVDDSTNEIPSAIEDILNNSNIENSKVFDLYDNNVINKNKLLTILTEKKDNEFDVVDLYFEKFKQDFLMDVKKLDYLKPMSKLNQNNSIVDNIISKIKKDHPSLFNSNNKSIDVVYFDALEECSHYSNKPVFEYLTNINTFNIYDDHNIDSAVKGLNYLQSDSFGYSSQKENFSICLKNDNEIIGFGHFYIENNVIRINTVNIASHYRGNGYIKDIYNKLCDISVEKNLPILTTMYSSDGNSILPKVKEKLFSERKDFLWLDSCSNKYSSQIDEIFSDSCVSNFILNNITKKYKNLSMRDCRVIIDKEKEHISKQVGNKKMDFFEIIEFRDSAQQRIIKSFDNLSSRLKNKKSNIIKRKNI